jgi:SagB-type dehydrogenase family enzyme
MLFNESQTREANLGEHERMISDELLAGDVYSTSITKLPKIARAGISVGDALARRKSVRDYDENPIRAQVIATALHSAHSMDAAEWPDEHRHSLRLTYLLLARNVEGINKGVYEYDPYKHGLTQVRASLSREQTVELLVQSEYADAPALVWIAGNLAAACARHGAWGHRQLLLRAGAAGHRLWMSVLGLGLSGSIFAGLVPGAARKYLGLDGYKKASLFAFAAGYQKRPQ